MTILPHAVSRLLHYQMTAVARPSQWVDSAACKAMQIHAEEIEVARRFWACPFQTLQIGGRSSSRMPMLSDVDSGTNFFPSNRKPRREGRQAPRQLIDLNGAGRHLPR
jgi:hypothetical protein